jgi:hypothetical protein
MHEVRYFHSEPSVENCEIRGIPPSMAAIAVMVIGRKRLSAARRIASCGDKVIVALRCNREVDHDEVLICERCVEDVGHVPRPVGAIDYRNWVYSGAAAGLNHSLSFDQFLEPRFAIEQRNRRGL